MNHDSDGFDPLDLDQDGDEVIDILLMEEESSRRRRPAEPGTGNGCLGMVILLILIPSALLYFLT